MWQLLMKCTCMELHRLCVSNLFMYQLHRQVHISSFKGWMVPKQDLYSWKPSNSQNSKLEENDDTPCCMKT